MRCFILPIVIAILLFSVPAPAAQYDRPGLYRVAECAPGECLTGSNHKLRPMVRISGDESRGLCFYNYEMETEFGLYKVESNRLLRYRIHEANVLSRSEELKSEGQILEGVGHSLKKMGTNLVAAVSDPVGTVKAIPRWFGKMYKRIRGVAGAEKKDAYMYQDSIAEGTFSGGWKRKIAYELQVDTYTTNPVMRELLQQMANYQATGGNVLRVASWFAPGGIVVGAALNAQRFAGWRIQLRDYSAGDLAIYNNERLLGYGLTQERADSFQDNPILSPVHKTVTLNAIDGLEKVKGRLLLLDLGRKTETEAQAIHMTLTALHLLGYHQEQTPLRSIKSIDGMFLCRDAKGRAVVPYLSDFLRWNEKTAPLFKKIRAKAGRGKKILLHDSKISPLAFKRLRKMGFTFMSAEMAVPTQATDFMPKEIAEPPEVVEKDPELPPQGHDDGLNAER